MVQSSCSVKNGKLNETIEVSALWSIIVRPVPQCPWLNVNPLAIGLDSQSSHYLSYVFINTRQNA